MSIREQIDQIVGENRDSEYTVLLQLDDKTELQQEFREAVSKIRRRRSIVSAPELLAEIDRINRRSSRSASRNTGTRSKSKAKSTKAVDIREQQMAELRIKTQGQMKRIQESDWFNDLSSRTDEGKRIASTTARRKGTQPSSRRGATSPTMFITSGIIPITVRHDDLIRLDKELSSLPVSSVFPNRTVRVPTITKSSAKPEEVEAYSTHTWGLERTGALAAWGAFNARGSGVKVAVLDTGIDGKHPELKDNLVNFAEFSATGQISREGVSNARDTHTHGTHCSGTVAGKNVNGRWIGMAPEAGLMGGVVLPKGLGTDRQILAGIEWAVTNGADIISLSLGGLSLTPDVLDTYTRAIINANRMGIPVVCAVGNDGSQTSGSPGNDYFALTVGATDYSDRAAGFSGGRTQIIETSQYIDPQDLPLVFSKPDVTAPGVNVYSTIPGNKFDTYNGSSMATPHVAGALALLLSGSDFIRQLPKPDRTEVLQMLLIASVKELGESGQNHRFGYGRLDVLRAFSAAYELDYL